MRAAHHVDAWRYEVRDVPLPVPAEGEALVRVMACGFCGSDAHDMATPPRRVQIPGHEFAGVVEEVRGDARVKPGDRVFVDPGLRCGVCPACRSGEDHLCPSVKVYGCRGDQPPGGFAEYVAVRADHLYPMNGDVTFEEATFADPVGVAIHAVSKAPKVAGADAVVFGCGPLGILTLCELRRRGAKHLVAVDIVPGKLALAARLTGCETLDARDAGSEEALAAREFDLAVDLAGGETPVIDQALRITRKGGTVLCVAQRPHGVRLNYQHLVFREINLQGVFGKPARDLEQAIDVIQSRAVDVRPLITACYPLIEIQRALEHFLQPDSIKILVQPHGQAA